MVKIYTRAYSANNPRQLVSGKGKAGKPPFDRLSNVELLNEFKNHANSLSEFPTALVSVSSRIIDTLSRAFNLYFENGERLSDIYIIFVKIPVATSFTGVTVHPAQPLAHNIDHWNPAFFRYESVFEWAIPEECVVHKVCLQTLLNRGLRYDELLRSLYRPTSALEMRKNVADLLNIDYPETDPWDIGVYLGCFARQFGARAPSNWIAHQFFYDCTCPKIVDDDVIEITNSCGDRKFVDFIFFRDLDQGIDTALIDWWLSNCEPSSDFEEFDK